MTGGSRDPERARPYVAPAGFVTLDKPALENGTDVRAVMLMLSEPGMCGNGKGMRRHHGVLDVPKTPMVSAAARIHLFVLELCLSRYPHRLIEGVARRDIDIETER